MFKDTEEFKKPLISDGRIDLIILAKMIWEQRKRIFFITLVFIAIGLVVSFASPVRYTSTVVVLPQTESVSELSGMGALAGLAGINLSSVIGDQSEVSTDIYPNIMKSYPFIYELMHTPFSFEEGEKSLYDRYVGDTIQSFGSQLVKYTIRLPWTIKRLLSANKEGLLFGDSTGTHISDLKVVDLEMRDVMRRVQMDLSLEKGENGLVIITGTAEEPLVSAQMTQKAMLLLQSMIVSYKTQRNRENLEFVKARYLEKKQEFEVSRKALLDFRDANRNRVAERVDFQYQMLSDSYEMAQSLYQNLAQQLEQSKISVQKETTVFTVVEPVVVPIQRSSPERTKIMILHIFIGGFVALLVVLGQIFWKYRSEIL